MCLVIMSIAIFWRSYAIYKVMLFKELLLKGFVSSLNHLKGFVLDFVVHVVIWHQ
jgi:hypothetical protein